MSWLYSLVWAVLPFFTSNRYALEGFLTSCSFDYISKNLSNRIVIVSIFIGGFFIPLILISLFYTLIIYLLRKSEIYLTYKIRNKSVTSSTNLNSLNINVESSLNHVNKKQSTITIGSKYSGNLKNSVYSKREIKLVKMVSLIVLMFVVAWTPYAVVTLAAQFGSNIESYINPYTTSLPALFAKTSSIYNPFIYTLSNKDFRRFFVKYLLRKIK